MSRRRVSRGLMAFLALCAVTAGAGEAGVPIADLVERIERAPEGGTILVPPGVYDGHLIVTKSVTLEGRGQVTIDGGGEGTVVELGAPGITFRGFTVRASGEKVNGEPAAIRALRGSIVIEDNVVEDALFGIDLRESPDSVVRGNTVVGKDLELGRRGDGIRLWWSNDCVVERNVVRGARDMVFWYSEGLSIAHNQVSGSRYGLHFMYSHDTTLSDNTLIGNSVGVYLMYSNGIRLVGNEMRSNRGPADTASVSRTATTSWSRATCSSPIVSASTSTTVPRRWTAKGSSRGIWSRSTKSGSWLPPHPRQCREWKRIRGERGASVGARQGVVARESLLARRHGELLVGLRGLRS